MRRTNSSFGTNLNGVELNEEGFQKLQEEIAMTSIRADCVMPWGKERVTFYFGETPVGEGLEPVLIRRGFVRQLLPDDARHSAAALRAYYRSPAPAPKVFELVECLTITASLLPRAAVKRQCRETAQEIKIHGCARSAWRCPGRRTLPAGHQPW